MTSTKRLYRRETNRVVLGILSGIAEYFSIDPTIVRVAYVVLAIFTGVLPAIIAYGIMALLIPTKGKGAVIHERTVPTPEEKARQSEADQNPPTV